MNKHDKTPHAYPNHYQDHNEVIKLLCELYPKCFFSNPKQRCPLKLGIVDDLKAANEPRLAAYNIAAAVGLVLHSYWLRLCLNCRC